MAPRAWRGIGEDYWTFASVVLPWQDVYLKTWRETPWYGDSMRNLHLRSGGNIYGGLALSRRNRKVWVPKRIYYEILREMTGQDLGNDPDAWEAWFKAHPDLRWDHDQKRIARRKAGMK